MTGRVTIEDMDVAAEWLDMNEGDEGEGDSCRRVAEWLRAEMQRRMSKNALRAAARKHGIPLAVAQRVTRK